MYFWGASLQTHSVRPCASSSQRVHTHLYFLCVCITWAPCSFFPDHPEGLDNGDVFTFPHILALMQRQTSPFQSRPPTAQTHNGGLVQLFLCMVASGGANTELDFRGDHEASEMTRSVDEKEFPGLLRIASCKKEYLTIWGVSNAICKCHWMLQNHCRSTQDWLRQQFCSIWHMWDRQGYNQ